LAWYVAVLAKKVPVRKPKDARPAVAHQKDIDILPVIRIEDNFF
jgi:hypothetical protein